MKEPNPPFGKPFNYTDSTEMKVLNRTKTLRPTWRERLQRHRRPKAWVTVEPEVDIQTKIIPIFSDKELSRDIKAAMEYEKAHPQKDD